MSSFCPGTQRPVYMDNSSTTKPFPEVVKALSRVQEETFGNPSSLHRLGAESDRLIKRSRSSVAALMGVPEDRVFFTSGGSEANNWAIFGSIGPAQSKFKHIITSSVEHPSVTAPLMHLKKLGYSITVVPVDEKGLVNADEVVAQIRKDTLLVSIVFVQNELGSIQPCKQIGRMLSGFGSGSRPRFHVDAVQGFARLEMDVHEWGVDLLSVSAHKIHGPKGVGALYIRKGVPHNPLIFGGGQEKGLRSGTENVSGIAGFGLACDIWAKKAHEAREILYELRKRLIDGIMSSFPEAVLNGPDCKNAAPHIVNFSFPGFRGESILHALEKRNVFVSTGSACASRTSRPNPIILALGKSKSEALSPIRFSMSLFTTREDVDETVFALQGALEELKPWRQKKI